MYLVLCQYLSAYIRAFRHSPRLISRMIPTSQSPGGVSSLTSSPAVSELVRVRLRSGREGEVHQVRNALLSATTIWILHTGHLSLCILIHEPVRCLALRFVLRFCGLRIARSGVASRRVGTDAAVGVGEEGLGCGDRWRSGRGTWDLLWVGGSLGEGRRLGRHRRRRMKGGLESFGVIGVELQTSVQSAGVDDA